MRSVPVQAVKRSSEARGWLLKSSEGATKAKGFSIFSGLTEANFNIRYRLILVDIRPDTGAKHRGSEIARIRSEMAKDQLLGEALSNKRPA